MVISIIGLLIGAIFLTKTLLRKYGWSFGKRARKNRIKTKKPTKLKTKKISKVKTKNNNFQ